MNINKTVGKSIARAKINLFLRITGKRADGYHTIQTLFLPLSDVADLITISKTSEAGISITSDSTELPLDESNICFKAADSFAKLADIEPNWRIEIQKNIPIAAGLGGGSSDAAAVLKILNENVKKIDQLKLHKLAIKLGADVPFFLNPVPSIATEIGDELQPIPMNMKLNLLLINPQFPVSAKWGYQRYSELKNEKKQAQKTDSKLENLLNILKNGEILDLSSTIINDLAPGVFEKFPIMTILTDQIKAFGAICTGMSGSGPTFFAICEDRRSVAKLAENLKNEWGDALTLIPGTVEVVV